MNLTTRSLGFALLLLLLFLGATLTLQWWLSRETRQLQSLAIEEQRARLVKIIGVSGRGPEQWDAAFQREMGAAVGGRVHLSRTDTPPLAPDPTTLSFVQQLPAYPGWRAQVQFAAPALLRVQILHQRTLIVIVLLALLMATVPLLLVLIGSRNPALPAGVTRTPWAAVRSQAAGMVHFAKISHEQSAALQEEHGARVRAEEDLETNRSLLGHSVASRVRLGRELHDNICQTLFAVCLTLESVQKKNSLAPELKQRLDQCLSELRRLNHEVRAFLEDLGPAQVNTRSFTEAVAVMLAPFSAAGGIQVEQRLDEEAVALIALPQGAEILNILREAVSNSVRHGQARHITLLAGRSDQQIAFAVQDDGTGYKAPQGGSGHGLANMQARAEALGGSVRVESVPGKGTRVLLTLPVVSPA